MDNGGLPQFSILKLLPPSPYLAKVLTQFGFLPNRIQIKRKFVAELGHHSVDSFCSYMNANSPDILALKLITYAGHESLVLYVFIA